MSQCEFEFYHEGRKVFSKTVPMDNWDRAAQEYLRAAGILGLKLYAKSFPLKAVAGLVS